MVKDISNEPKRSTNLEGGIKDLRNVKCGHYIGLINN